MQSLKVPHCLEGEEKRLEIEIDLETLQKLKKAGFKIDKGVVLWDCFYMMNDDLKVFKKGAEEQELLESILNITL